MVDAPVFPPARIIPSSLSSNASLRSLAYDAARKAFVLGLQTAFSDASGRLDPMSSGLLRFSYTTSVDQITEAVRRLTAWRSGARPTKE